MSPHCRYPSRGTRPHGSRNQNQDCMHGSTGTAGRLFRELEAIAASDVYLSPANDTDTPREALLKHDESHVAVKNSSESFSWR